MIPVKSTLSLVLMVAIKHHESVQTKRFNPNPCALIFAPRHQLRANTRNGLPKVAIMFTRVGEVAGRQPSNHVLW